MASLSEMVAALFGSKEPLGPPTVRYPTNPPQAYPTAEDVTFARKQDYSYGQPWAREFGGHNMRVLTSDPNAKEPHETSRIPLEHEPRIFKAMPELWDVHAKAALASQNSALAQLGYDPNVVALDVARDPERVNILGRYRRGGPENLDDIYSNARTPATLAHESLHRGIAKLQESPHWKKEFDTYRPRSTVPHELAVRWLMAKKMGDPEKEPIHGQMTDRSQRVVALDLFDDHTGGPARRKTLDEMEAAAAKYLAEKRPRGPR